jgi:Protein kinase domain
MAASTSLIVEVWDKLKPALEAKRSYIGPDLQRLLDQGFGLSLQDLLKISHPEDLDASSLLYSLIILKLKEAAPLGTQAAVYTEYFLWLYNQNINFKDALAATFTSYLICEINEVSTIDGLVTWMNSLIKLQGLGIDLSSVENLVYIKYMEFAWETLDHTIEPSNPDKIVKYLEYLKAGQVFKLDLGDLVQIVGTNVCRFVENDHDLNGLKAIQGLDYNKDFSSGRIIIAKLKEIHFNDNEILERVQQIVEKIGEIVQEIPNPVPYPRQNLNSFEFPPPSRNPHELNFDQIQMIESIYSKANEKYGVVVWKATHPDVGFIAVKEYTVKRDIKDFNELLPEKDIMEKLSALSGPDNYFLKYYGSSVSQNKLYLVMEYHQYNLMDTITIYKNSNHLLPETSLETIIFRLIYSFAYMESLKIYHQDIKPHNILVTERFDLRIIDFSISELRANNEFTQALTGFVPIQGTIGYCAPEIQDMLDKNLKAGTIRRGKADVFSLGLTILQLVLMENLVMLNRFDTNVRLLEKVNTVKIEWVKILLSKMLQADYNNRPSFKEALNYVPKGVTTRPV